MLGLSNTLSLVFSGIVALVLAAGSGWVVHKVDAGTIAAAKAETQQLRLDDAQALVAGMKAAAAKQAALDKITHDADVAEAAKQKQIVTRTVTLTKEVPVYVTAQQDASTCVSYGLIRVLVAAARGVDPATLALPAGELNESCTGLPISAVAATLGEVYGVAEQNAEQLNALEDAISKAHAVQVGPAASQ
jgi:hypothetical protein